MYRYDGCWGQRLPACRIGSLTLARSPQIRWCGEAAFSVDFGDVIDLAVNARVHALDQAVMRAVPDGLIECTPTYRALFVSFDPLLTDGDSLAAHCLSLASDGTVPPIQGRSWRVPICFDLEFAEDLPFLAEKAGLTQSGLIELLTADARPLYMIGFAPGYPFLGDLPPVLKIPRRTEPRPRVPPGTLIIANAQASLTTVELPSGWYLGGRTPERCWRPNATPPSLFSAGDRISFRAIDRDDFDELAEQASAGAIVSDMITS